MSADQVRRFGAYLVGVPRCIACRKLLGPKIALGAMQGGDVLCAECRALWEREKLALCPDCGQPHIDCRCMPDALAASGTLGLIHLGAYRAGTVVGQLILRLKDAELNRVARFLGGQLAPVVRRALTGIGIDPATVTVTYLPRGRRSRLRVGHDQAELVAWMMARYLGADCRRLLIRDRDSAAQKTLSAEQRLANVSGAFAVSRANAVEGRIVLLVDDIVTTGASLSEGVRALRHAGARAVICVTVGYTGQNIRLN